jgi:hypothetical protein
MPHSMASNHLYEKGYKGYTMLKKNGDGMTVKYEDVGVLAKEVHKRLLPLKDGPFGGDEQPVTKAVSAIYMEVNDGPLSKETYDDIDAFKEAIDALPNPAAPRAAEASAVSAQEMQQAIAELYNRTDSMSQTIKALQATVANLERQNVDLQFQLRNPGRGVPQQ